MNEPIQAGIVGLVDMLHDESYPLYLYASCMSVSE